MSRAERSMLQRIWDFYRIAPFGETMVIFNVIVLISAIKDLSTENIPMPLPLVIPIQCILGILVGKKVIERQFALKTRLTEILSRRGYSSVVQNSF